MILSLLSLFTPMIKRLTCLPHLLIVNTSNSFVKTLVLSPWDDLHVYTYAILRCFSHKYKKKKWKMKKYKNNVCFVYIGTCVPWMAIVTKFSKLCIICNLDEYFYAQLSKWALWFLFVMSKIKLSFVLNTHITFFDGND